MVSSLWMLQGKLWIIVVALKWIRSISSIKAEEQDLQTAITYRASLNNCFTINCFENWLGKNFIRFKSATFLLNDLRTFFMCSCHESLLLIVNPGHLDDNLYSIVLLPYVKYGKGPGKFLIRNYQGFRLTLTPGVYLV